MRILWFILLVSTVGFGRCGNPGDGQVTPQNGKPPAAQEGVNGPVGQPAESSPSPIPPKDIGMDIADLTKVDLKLFTLSETFMGGILVKKTLTPNDGYRLTEVTDGQESLWKSSGQDYHAKSVVVHYSKNGSHLLSITINDGHSTRPKCFEKNGSSWTEISDDEFNKRHDLMMEEFGVKSRVIPESDDDSPEDDGSTEAPKVLTTSSPKPATPVDKEDVQAKLNGFTEKPDHPLPPVTAPQGQLPLQPTKPAKPKVEDVKPDDGTKPHTVQGHGEKPLVPVPQQTQPIATQVKTPVTQRVTQKGQMGQPANPPGAPQNAQKEGAKPVTLVVNQGNKQHAPPALGAQGTLVQTTQLMAEPDQQTPTQKSDVGATPDEEITPATPAGKHGQPAGNPPATAPTDAKQTVVQAKPTTIPSGQGVGMNKPACQQAPPHDQEDSAGQSANPPGAKPPTSATPQGNKEKAQAQPLTLDNVESAGEDETPRNVPDPQATTQVDQKPQDAVDQLVAKFDGTLFTAQPGMDSGVVTLKLTAKAGVTAKKVTFDGKEVWSGGWISRDPCSSAMLYFDGESPILAVIYKLSGGKEEPKVYRYHDGKKWKDYNETTHKTKVDELKRKHPPAPVDTNGTSPNTQDTQEEASPGGDTTTPSPSDDPSSENTPQNGQDGQHNGEPTEQSKEDPLPPEETNQGNTQPDSPEIDTKESADTQNTAVPNAQPSPGETSQQPTPAANQENKQQVPPQQDGQIQDPKTLDLAKPESSICRSFEVNIQGAPAKVYAVFSSVNVTKIVHSDKTVWTSQGAESCFYCASFLKESNPAVTAIRIKGQNLSQSFCELKGDDWNVSQDDNDKKINALKPANSNAPTKFSLDIDATTNNNCNITSENNNIVTIRNFAPKPGHAIEKVLVGKNEIWKAGEGEYCYLCEYCGKNSVTFLRIHIESNYQLSLSCHKREVNKTWEVTSGKDFNDELVKWSGSSSKA